MKARERLFYWVGGGILVGIIIGMCISPLTAQDGKFGEITCTDLKVLHPDGSPAVWLARLGSYGVMSVYAGEELRASMSSIGKHGGAVTIYGKDEDSYGRVSISEHGGHVSIHGKDGNSRANMGIVEHGGYVSVDGKDRKSRVDVGISEHGGQVFAYGKGESQVAIAINEYGNGAVSTWDKNGYRLATLK